MILYDGVPVSEVDFESEFNKELSILKASIESIERRHKNYQYWTIKLHNANKCLEIGEVTLNGN